MPGHKMCGILLWKILSSIQQVSWAFLLSPPLFLARRTGDLGHQKGKSDLRKTQFLCVLADHLSRTCAVGDCLWGLMVSSPSRNLCMKRNRYHSLDAEAWLSGSLFSYWALFLLVSSQIQCPLMLDSILAWNCLQESGNKQQSTTEIKGN